MIFTKRGYRFRVSDGAEGVFLYIETITDAWALVWSNTAEPENAYLPTVFTGSEP